MKNITENNSPIGSAMVRRFVLLSALASVVALAVVVALVDATGKGSDPAVAAEEASSSSQTRYAAVRPRSGHSDYLRGLTRSALREGFGQDGVILLAPRKGPGREVIARQLQDLVMSRNMRLGRRLSFAGLKPGKTDTTHTTLVGPNGYMKVSADGTKFELRGNIDDPDELRRASANGRMLEKGELERLGRGFIREKLGDFVKLGNEESLTFLGVKYLRNGEFDENGQRGSEEVVANIAIFGREVRGVPVIGSGSKVAVWFANDREPVGVDVDWPVYQVTQTRQKVLSRERLNARVRETTVPTNGSDRAEVARFECGYVDLGGRKRGASLQAGCSIHYAGRQDDGTLWARVEYVPAGDNVIADPQWPLARLIASGKTMNTDTYDFARYISVTPLPKVDPTRGRPSRIRNPR